MIPSSAKGSSPPRARWTVLCAFVLLSGVAGECRWRFSSNTSGRNHGSQNSDLPAPLTLGGPSDSVLPVPGGRALLYTRTSGIDCSAEIRWLDLETGNSWALLHGLLEPRLLRVFEEQCEFSQGPCETVLFSFRFDEDAPDWSASFNDLFCWLPHRRPLSVDRSGNLSWTEGGSTLRILLALPAAGAVYETGWPAPLAWDGSGDLHWVDLASGAGVPALPFRTGRR